MGGDLMRRPCRSRTARNRAAAGPELTSPPPISTTRESCSMASANASTSASPRVISLDMAQSPFLRIPGQARNDVFGVISRALAIRPFPRKRT